MKKHKPLLLADEGPQYATYLTTDAKNPDARPARKKDVTVDAVARLLDQHEEGDNYHALCGSYAGLAALLRSQLFPDQQILELLRSLVDVGGFRGLREKEKGKRT